MTIREALLSDEIRCLRVEYGDRWLVGSSGEFTVYEHPYRARRNEVLYQGTDEEKAVRLLIEG
jgi:hypothetical protein